jgi:short subunit dehydrogenase-like uncharacterized protein
MRAPITPTCAVNPVWMRQMIDKHHDAAKGKLRAHRLSRAGFDSIPFDLGVLMLQKHATEKVRCACSSR